MFAIVDIAGFQERVEKGAKLQVPLLEGQEGDTVTFERVLLIADGTDVTFGAPHISGAAVGAKIIGVGKSDKVRTAKFKRRKRHLKFKGHRQDFMNIEITSIDSSKKK